MTNNAPEGMMPVDEFGKIKGMSAEKVIGRIRDGFYVGRKVDDDWFVAELELQDEQTKHSSNVAASSVYLGKGNSNEVIVTDIKMPFGSMVVFMVKAAIAFIPAFIILTIIGMLVFGMLGGIFEGMGHIG